MVCIDVNGAIKMFSYGIYTKLSGGIKWYVNMYRCDRFLNLNCEVLRSNLSTDILTELWSLSSCRLKICFISMRHWWKVHKKSQSKKVPLKEKHNLYTLIDYFDI